MTPTGPETGGWPAPGRGGSCPARPAPELLTWRVRSWGVGLAFDAVADGRVGVEVAGSGLGEMPAEGVEGTAAAGGGSTASVRRSSSTSEAPTNEQVKAHQDAGEPVDSVTGPAVVFTVVGQ